MAMRKSFLIFYSDDEHHIVNWVLYACQVAQSAASQKFEPFSTFHASIISINNMVKCLLSLNDDPLTKRHGPL